jgi:hypothetical protein
MRQIQLFRKAPARILLRRHPVSSRAHSQFFLGSRTYPSVVVDCCVPVYRQRSLLVHKHVPLSGLHSPSHSRCPSRHSEIRSQVTKHLTVIARGALVLLASSIMIYCVLFTLVCEHIEVVIIVSLLWAPCTSTFDFGISTRRNHRKSQDFPANCDRASFRNLGCPSSPPHVWGQAAQLEINGTCYLYNGRASVPLSTSW